jgi:glycosyltransferase involved in cell wall biosynthesis
MTHVRASVVLLTYNQEAFVQDALQSLLDQDYDNLEIIVSDDSSHDGTWLYVEKIATAYSGNKEIKLNRNEHNVGIVANYYKAFGLSSGEVVFTAAGDDISLPDRCSESIGCWLKNNRKFDLIATDGYDMGIDGHIFGVKKTDDLQAWDMIKWIKYRPFIFGASHMMTRRLISIRTLNSALPVEDQNFTARALMMGGALRLALPLVKHRRGGVSQMKNRWTYAEKRERLIKSASDALLESDEVSRDAELLGVEIVSLLRRNRETNGYALAMLKARKRLSQLRIAYDANQVPFPKRVRFFTFVMFDAWNGWFMWVKNKCKSYF